MSQSNAPSNNQPDPHQSKSMDEAPLIWRDPFTGMYEQEDSEVDFLVVSLAEIEMTPTDGAVEVAETEPIAPSAESSQPEESVHPAEPPELADLVSLIQELNQCNSALLDRVSQLEEALEQSHSSLPCIESTEPMPQNLPKAQEQITTLYNQLEFAHQTNQRQQILLETLTDQLEASQERVAQLERETSLLQQRYTEQSQILAQTEGNCRDLQTRLYRQQRYTLQFKAALEKCLEVPVPQYEGQELPSAQTASDYLFLPKAQRIKPWAAQSNSMPGKMPWMNITPGALDNFQSEDAHLKLQPNENLNLPTFTLPELQAPHMPSVQAVSASSEEVWKEEARCSADTARVAPPTIHSQIDPVTDPTLDPTLDPVADDPALMAHISSIVQPLADLIAEAMLAEPFPVDALQSTIAPPSPEPVSAPAVSELTSELMHKPAQPIATEPKEILPPPLEVPMADAEDALWQDLARLIEVSTEDVVKASLSGDFAAFEAIDFAALENATPTANIEQDPWDVPAVSSQAASPQPISPQVLASVPVPKPQPVEAPVQKAVQSPTIRQPAAVQSPLNPVPQSSVPAFVANSQNSPSPLVYPLRPLKKRQSLAMVELPDFNKQPSSPVSH
ncbi:MAG: hypothetical protein KME11_16000 [Timaviella obliquedivisa GSE-PSE-MK23-08B]|jgi:hypothetical protein|nr:hypothetical protein [Timaviella obliquedivisa GSE-PSE-MK23-08B]